MCKMTIDLLRKWRKEEGGRKRERGREGGREKAIGEERKRMTERAMSYSLHA